MAYERKRAIEEGRSKPVKSRRHEYARMYVHDKDKDGFLFELFFEYPGDIEDVRIHVGFQLKESVPCKIMVVPDDNSLSDSFTINLSQGYNELPDIHMGGNTLVRIMNLSIWEMRRVTLTFTYSYNK